MDVVLAFSHVVCLPVIAEVVATWQDFFAIGKVPCGSHCQAQHIIETPKGAEQVCPVGLSPWLSRFTAF